MFYVLVITHYLTPLFPYSHSPMISPRADINELISPDLLHQVIKGTFKDHLVAWVEDYLVLTHGRTGANVILSDIDARYEVISSL